VSARQPSKPRAGGARRRGGGAPAGRSRAAPACRAPRCAARPPAADAPVSAAGRAPVAASSRPLVPFPPRALAPSSRSLPLSSGTNPASAACARAPRNRGNCVFFARRWCCGAAPLAGRRARQSGRGRRNRVPPLAARRRPNAVPVLSTRPAITMHSYPRPNPACKPPASAAPGAVCRAHTRRAPVGRVGAGRLTRRRRAADVWAARRGDFPYCLRPSRDAQLRAAERKARARHPPHQPPPPSRWNGGAGLTLARVVLRAPHYFCHRDRPIHRGARLCPLPPPQPPPGASPRRPRAHSTRTPLSGAPAPATPHQVRPRVFGGAGAAVIRFAGRPARPARPRRVPTTRGPRGRRGRGRPAPGGARAGGRCRRPATPGRAQPGRVNGCRRSRAPRGGPRRGPGAAAGRGRGRSWRAGKLRGAASPAAADALR
jgi:hypothetical protein